MHWFDNDQYNGHLKELVLYHLIHGRIYAENFVDGTYYETLLQGQSLFASVFDYGSVTVNYDSAVLGFDNWARNGLMQGVEKVLLPLCAQETVLEVVKSRARGFYDLLEESGLWTLLQDNSSPMTILAPMDSALNETFIHLSGSAEIKAFVEYHIISDVVLAAEAIGGDGNYSNAFGTDVDLSHNDIVETDVLGSNGVVHFIDRVLAPTPELTLWDLLSQLPEMENFRAALIAARLNETLQASGPMTIFAPTNEAMESLTVRPGNQQDKRDLLYHIVDGQHLRNDFSDQLLRTTSRDNVLINVQFNGDVTLNGLVDVSSFDHEASNGVLHVISERLRRPTDLVSTAVNRGMTSFVHALEVSNLAASAFQEEGPYTIFGWSDSAWARFEDADAILQDPVRLRSLLLYHVVPEFLLFDDIEEGNYTTMLEQDVQIQYDYAESASTFHVQINDAYISGLDFLASNGCLHRISEVLVPAE